MGLDSKVTSGLCSGAVGFQVVEVPFTYWLYLVELQKTLMRSLHNFQVGDKVVYPNHGIGVVDQISTRSNGFMIERFYLLTIKSSSMKVMVPCGNARNVGLRSVVTQDEVERILCFLGEGLCSSNADWKERYREHCDKMKAGSLMEVAEVLKSLLVLNQKKSLGLREQKMLEKARYLLVNEIVQATGASEPGTDDALLEALERAGLRFPDIIGEA